MKQLDICPCITKLSFLAFLSLSWLLPTSGLQCRCYYRGNPPGSIAALVNATFGSLPACGTNGMCSVPANYGCLKIVNEPMYTASLCANPQIHAGMPAGQSAVLFAQGLAGANLQPYNCTSMPGGTNGVCYCDASDNCNSGSLKLIGNLLLSTVAFVLGVLLFLT